MENKNKNRGGKYLIILQIIKFVITGGLNTLIDFMILNILMWTFGIYSGSLIFLFNIISFSCAVINSYVLNKYWTFREKSKKDIPMQVVKFMVVSIIGALINSSIVFLAVTMVSPLFGLSEKIWVNLTKILATGVTLGWNFIGYKFWALKSQGSISPVDLPKRRTR